MTERRLPNEETHTFFWLLVAALAVVPLLIGSVWVARFLIWHRLLGHSVSRSHYWSFLSAAGLAMVIPSSLVLYGAVRHLQRAFRPGNLGSPQRTSDGSE